MSREGLACDCPPNSDAPARGGLPAGGMTANSRVVVPGLRRRRPGLTPDAVQSGLKVGYQARIVFGSLVAEPCRPSVEELGRLFHA